MNAIVLFLTFLGVAVIQVFIGGMRPVFAIPGYTALAGVSSLFLLRRNRPLPSLICLASTLLFAGYLLWRAYNSPVEYLSRPDRFLILGCLLVYFIFALCLTDPKWRLLFIYGLLLLAVGHIAIGAIQFSKGENFLPFNYLRHDYGRRASGFYVCPNHYAGLLEMLAVVAAAIGCWAKIGIKTRIVVLYFTLMALAGLALSGSRGGYLSITVAFVTFAAISVLVTYWTRPERTLIVGCVAVGLLLLVGITGVSIMKKDLLLVSRVNSIIDQKNMRLQLWDAALRQYQTQPATGTGAGTYLYLGRLYRDPSVTSDPVWVHNDYLHLLAEYGHLGAAAGLLFLAAHLWHGGRGIRQLVEKRLRESNQTTSSALALSIGALAAIAAILAHSVVDFNAHIPGNALVLAALFGIVANPPTFRPRTSESPNAGSLLPRLLLPVCSAVIFVDATPHWRAEWFSEKARVALRDGRYLVALRESQKGLELEKTNPELHYLLGESRRLFGNAMTNEAARKTMNEAALVAFSEAIKLFPQETKFWVKMSQALDITGRHDEALDHLEKARALDPKLPALNTFYAAHYQLLGDNKKALEYYAKAKDSALGAAGQADLLRQIQEDGAR